MLWTCASRTPLIKIWIFGKAQKQRLNDLVLRGPCAVRVIGFVADFVDPGIEKGVSRPAIESADYLFAIEKRCVGYSTHIDDRPMLACLAKLDRMKGRGQRRSLTSGGEVLRTEFGHGGNARRLGYRRGVADLECVTLA